MITQFELQILDQIHSAMNTPLLDQVFKTLTHLADKGIGLIVFALVLTAIPKTRRIGAICLISLAIGALITNVTLKNIVGRIRPYEYKDIALLVKEQADFSFPSGHATASFAVSFVLLKEKFKIGKVPFDYLFLVLAILIAFSRLYLYVHFPTDVIAGVLVGWIASVLAIKIYKEIIKRRNINKQL